MLVRAGHDIRDAKIHYGTSTTWLGFSHDKYKAAIDPLAIKDHSVLDVMVSNNVAALSFCHPGLFDPKDGQLIDIVMYDDNAPLQGGRYFASDHSLIGADFTVMD